MYSKKQKTALSFLLNALNRGRKTVTSKELADATENCEEPTIFERLGGGESVEEFLERNRLIAKVGEGRYDIVTDIAALRKFFLSEDEEKEEVLPEGPDLEKLLSSSWTVKDGDEAETEEGAEEATNGMVTEDDRQDYYRARRLALLRHWREMHGNDGNNNDGNNDNDGDDDEDDDDDEDGESDPAFENAFRIEPALLHIIHEVKDGFGVRRDENGVSILPHGLMIGGRTISFSVVQEDGKRYLSDRGFADSFIEEGKLTEEALDGFLYGGVVRVQGELRFEIADPEDAVPGVFKLYCILARAAEAAGVKETAGEEVPAIPDLLADLLDRSESDPSVPMRERANEFLCTSDRVPQVPEEKIEGIRDTIVRTLSDLHIPARIRRCTVGPAFLTYEVETEPDRVQTVVRRDIELGMRLKLENKVRVARGDRENVALVEVPLEPRYLSPFSFYELFETKKEKTFEDGSRFLIGMDGKGKRVEGDIAKLKHILVGGIGMSGKTNFLKNIILSLIGRYSPEEVRLAIVEARGEFSAYEGMPHLLTGNVLREEKEIRDTFMWAIDEADRRYSLMKEKGVSDLRAYNAVSEEKLFRVFFILDEYALLPHATLNGLLQRIVQKTAAAGIHLIVVTRRPSGIFSRELLENFPTRISFLTLSDVDSMQFIGTGGAEKLSARGELLLCELVRPPVRVLTALIERSVEVQFVRSAGAAYSPHFFSTAETKEKDGIDPVYIKALALVIETGNASVSYIQRACSVGYNHAGRILEWMEMMGYVSPFGEGGRKVLLSREEFRKKFGDPEE